MNGRWLAFLAAVVMTAALVTADGLLLRVGYALVAALLLTFLTSWSAVRWVDVSRRTRARRAEVGGTCDEQLTIVNGGWLPKPWLEIKDHSDLPGHRVSRAFTGLAPGGRRSWSVRTRCIERGLYTLGPLTFAGGDPLGMFRFERELARTAPFLVYPRTVDLPGVDLDSGYFPGGPAMRRRARLRATDVRGVRPYEPGDAINRIHWRTTARRGRLYTKEFEADPIVDTWLLLDLDEAVQAGHPPTLERELADMPWQEVPPGPLTKSTEEYGITICASLGKRLLEGGRSVGLLAHGQRTVVLDLDRGDRQLGRLLANLAVLHATGNASLVEILTAESHRFVRHTALVCITPSTDARWIDALHELRYRGVACMAIVLDAGTFEQGQHVPSVEPLLASRSIPWRCVRADDDLASALRG